MGQQGIGCERCHGPGAAHAMGEGPIVNPAKLPAERRDSICMQCHLEGNAAIQQPGLRLNDFQPGDELEDYVHYYVLSGAGRELRAASQFEALSESVCKRKSGNAFTCTTCHDPHSAPNESEKARYYNGKCLACHTMAGAKSSKHFRGNRDCVACHMPRATSADVAHTQATDHRILRNPSLAAANAREPSQIELRRFPSTDGKANERDLALSWQTIAEGGMEAALPEAEKY